MSTARYFRAEDGTVRMMHRAHTLGDPEAPLPLTRRDAIRQAARLRAAGMDWTGVAAAMRLYHGHYVTAHGWWHAVHKWHGPARPRSSRHMTSEHLGANV